MTAMKLTVSALGAFLVTAVCWLGVLPRDLPPAGSIEAALTSPEFERTRRVQTHPATDFPISKSGSDESVVWVRVFQLSFEIMGDRASLPVDPSEVANGIFVGNPYATRRASFFCGNVPRNLR
jgi:hypothetical protein